MFAVTLSLVLVCNRAEDYRKWSNTHPTAQNHLPCLSTLQLSFSHRYFPVRGPSCTFIKLQISSPQLPQNTVKKIYNKLLRYRKIWKTKLSSTHCHKTHLCVLKGLRTPTVTFQSLSTAQQTHFNCSLESQHTWIRQLCFIDEQPQRNQNKKKRGNRFNHSNSYI